MHCSHEQTQIVENIRIQNELMSLILADEKIKSVMSPSDAYFSRARTIDHQHKMQN